MSTRCSVQLASYCTVILLQPNRSTNASCHAHTSNLEIESSADLNRPTFDKTYIFISALRSQCTDT